VNSVRRNTNSDTPRAVALDGLERQRAEQLAVLHRLGVQHLVGLRGRVEHGLELAGGRPVRLELDLPAVL